MLLNYLSGGFLGGIVGLMVLIIASITDIRTREVPDWLNYGFFFFVVGNALILFFYHQHLPFLINTGLGLLLGLAIGLLMFYTGQWGGGDSKLIIGLSGLIGLSLSELSSIPLLLVFFVNMLLVGAAYGLVYTMVKAAINWKALKSYATDRYKQKVFRATRILLYVFIVFAFIFFLVLRDLISTLVLGIALMAFVFFYFSLIITFVERKLMIKKINLKELTEGEWIVEGVKKGRKILLKPSKTGVTKEEISLLKKNKIRQIMIKIGIPFVPSFLVAFILTITAGNWLLLLF